MATTVPAMRQFARPAARHGSRRRSVLSLGSIEVWQLTWLLLTFTLCYRPSCSRAEATTEPGVAEGAGVGGEPAPQPSILEEGPSTAGGHVRAVWQDACGEGSGQSLTVRCRHVHKVLVVGANGAVGRRVVSLLRHHPHYEPVAMIRSASQRSTFDKMGVMTVLADLEYPIDHAMAGVGAVIFVAGSGSKTGKDKTVLVDHLGAIRAVVAAQTNNVARFVMLSAVNAGVDANTSIAHYHRAKGYADMYIRDMATFAPALHWTIVAPPRLHNGEMVGAEVGLETVVSPDDPSVEQRGEGVHRPKARASRALVAATLVAVLPLTSTHGKAFRLMDGHQTLVTALGVLAEPPAHEEL
eukprot:COSAG01_NODE_4346_length_5115_cov_138.753040_2_plen_354_part_00